MASTLDFALQNVQDTFKNEAAAIMNGTLNDVLHGRKIDPNNILVATENAINGAIGNLINQSVNAVNQQVAAAMGSVFRNSSINVIAGNYAGGVLKSVITGKGIPPITRLMTTQIGQGLSQELYSQLPSGLTKTINVDVLGTNVGLSLAPVVNRALNGAVDAVIASIFDGAPLSDALTSSFPSMKDMSDLSGLSSLIDTTYGKIDDTLGTIDNFINFAANIGEVPIDELSGALLLDLDRYIWTGAPAGKLISLANQPLGKPVSNMKGMAREEYEALQKNLAESNISHPLASLGGSFEGIDDIIQGIKTNAGVRAITTNLADAYHTIRTEFGLLTEEEEKADEDAKDRSEELAIGLSEKALFKAAQFDATSTDQLVKLTTIKNGFVDPNAQYPTPEYADRPDVNKLATRDPENTVIDQKDNDRHLGARLPNGQSWDQPPSSYNARYPYNHVQESESGHIMEIDDTPGSERLHTRHRTGTGYEIDPMGNQVKTIKGSDYTIIDKNGYISIVGRANVSVGGGAFVHIAADAHIEVGGNAFINSGNNIELGAAGAIKIAAAERIDLKSRDICIDADNSISINADVAFKIHAKEVNVISDTDIKIETYNDLKLEARGNTDIKTTGTTKMYSGGAMDIKSDGVTHVESKGEMHIKSGADFKASSNGSYHAVANGTLYNTAKGGACNIVASGAVNLDGSPVNLSAGSGSEGSSASGAASAGSANASETEYSTANYPSTTRTPVHEDIIHEAPAKHYAASEVVSVAMNAITSGRDALDDEEKAKIVGRHAIDPKVIDRTPIEDTNAKGSKRTPSQAKTLIVPEEMPIGDTIPPDNLKLSPHFTIGDLTTKAVNGYKLRSNNGILPMSKIVANLQFLALNILEPIYAYRPDLVIDTCFKPFDEKSKKADRNNFGLSISLDFKHAARHTDYYDIANIIQHVCTFDELILWYLTPDFVKSNKETGLLVFNVAGVFNPLAGSKPSALPKTTASAPLETKVT